MIVLITYDLKQPGRNYTPLYETIKSLGEWQHPLESTWFVQIDEETDLNEVVELLKKSADKGDLFFAEKLPVSIKDGFQNRFGLGLIQNRNNHGKLCNIRKV